MQLPSSLIAVTLPLGVTAVALAFTLSRRRQGANLNVLQMLVVALASAMGCLVLLTACSYLLLTSSRATALVAALIASVGVYFLALWLLARKTPLSASAAAFASVAGLVPLYFVLAYSGLLVACSFGDCL